MHDRRTGGSMKKQVWEVVDGLRTTESGVGLASSTLQLILRASFQPRLNFRTCFSMPGFIKKMERGPAYSSFLPLNMWDYLGPRKTVGPSHLAWLALAGSSSPSSSPVLEMPEMEMYYAKHELQLCFKCWVWQGRKNLSYEE